MRGFWTRCVLSMAHQQSRVSISRAVLVDGGLSPPPSRLYPGRKCYMVTVTYGGAEHLGFGPTPSIARMTAIRLASRAHKEPQSSVTPLPPSSHPPLPFQSPGSPRPCHPSSATPLPIHPYSNTVRPSLPPSHMAPNGFISPISHPPLVSSPSKLPLLVHPLFLHPSGFTVPFDFYQGHEESSSDDDDDSCQLVSLGLHEVVPKQSCPLRNNHPNNHGNVTLSSFSPFEECAAPLSDPFQFTVRLPRKRTPSTSCKPPWKDILSAVRSPPAKVDSWPTEAPGSRNKCSGEGGLKSLPTHFLLQNGSLELNSCKGRSVKPLATADEGVSVGSGGRQRLAGFYSTENEEVLRRDVCVGLPTEGLLL